MTDPITVRPPRDVALRLVRRIAYFGNLNGHAQAFTFNHRDAAEIPPGYVAVVRVELAQVERTELRTEKDEYE